jgi:hypothetical protein
MPRAPTLDTSTQAGRVIARFGGPRQMLHAMHMAGYTTITLATIYRWTYPTPRGTGGMIPNFRLKEVLDTARRRGVNLTSDDLSIVTGG